MTPLVGEAAICLPLGLGIGFCIGLTGVGGGVLVVPALVGILGLGAPAAIATASVYSCLTKCYAVVEHARLRTIASRNAWLFLLGAVPGTVLAAIAITRLAGNVDAMRALNWLILAVIIASGILILLGMRRKAPATASQESSASRGRLAAGIALGFIAGALIGATGVGGGVAVIPILTGCFRLDMARTVGTSILIAVVLTLVASGVYQLLGHAGGVPSAAPAWSAAILMTCGSLAGVYAGARMGRRMPEKALQWAVLAMVLLAAGGMAAKVWSTA